MIGLRFKMLAAPAALLLLNLAAAPAAAAVPGEVEEARDRIEDYVNDFDPNDSPQTQIAKANDLAFDLLAIFITGGTSSLCLTFDGSPIDLPHLDYDYNGNFWIEFPGVGKDPDNAQWGLGTYILVTNGNTQIRCIPLFEEPLPLPSNLEFLVECELTLAC